MFSKEKVVADISIKEFSLRIFVIASSQLLYPLFRIHSTVPSINGNLVWNNFVQNEMVIMPNQSISFEVFVTPSQPQFFFNILSTHVTYGYTSLTSV